MRCCFQYPVFVSLLQCYSVCYHSNNTGNSYRFVMHQAFRTDAGWTHLVYDLRSYTKWDHSAMDHKLGCVHNCKILLLRWILWLPSQVSPNPKTQVTWLFSSLKTWLWDYANWVWNLTITALHRCSSCTLVAIYRQNVEVSFCLFACINFSSLHYNI